MDNCIQTNKQSVFHRQSMERFVRNFKTPNIPSIFPLGVMYHSPSSTNVPINQTKTLLLIEVHYVFYNSNDSCEENGYKTAAEYKSVHSGWKHHRSREEMWGRATLLPTLDFVKFRYALRL
jgi:hypothetical protein